MNTTERLNKIAQAKQSKDNAEMLAHEEEMNATRRFINHLLSYGERIKALMEVGNALIDNGFPLGPHDCFASDCISHKFGFVTTGCSIWNNVKIHGVGRCGGGYCGENLTVTENEVVSLNECYSCEQWTANFDAFEKEFYDYLDSL